MALRDMFNKSIQRETDTMRSVYSGREGRDEVQRILLDCHLFDSIDPNDPNLFTKLARRNYAIEFLYKLGILVDDNIPIIVDRLMDIEYTKEAK